MNTLLNDVQPRLRTNTIYENEYTYLTTKRDDLSVIIGTMNASKVLPNSQLTDAHSDAAKLAYAAKVNNEQGRAKAQEYLDANGLNKTIVDANRYGIMVRDNTTGRLTLGLRGMNPLDARDQMNVAKQLLGVDESRVMAKRMIEKVGAENVDIAAFSMGGSTGLDLCLDYNMRGVLIDPPVNIRHIVRNSLATRERTNTIEIVRNPENVISSGTMFRNVSMFPQYEVSVVPTGSSGLIESHKLVPNFTKNQVEDFHASAMDMMRRGNFKAQTDTMIDMKRAIDRGETFTEFYRDLNSRDGRPSGVDVDVDGVFGKLGNRVNRASLVVRMWELLGGTFTQSETAHLASTASGEAPELFVDDETVDLIRNNRLREAERVSQDIFETGVSALENTEVAAHPAVKASILETLADQAHPTALGVGLVAAIAGGELSDAIDPSGSFGRGDRVGVDLHQALSGGLGATFTEVGMAGMSGAALGAEALPVIGAGAVGAVAGTETQLGVYEALDRAGANSDTKQSLSDIAGGAVGGAVFSGASIAGAAALGAEVGAVGGLGGIVVGGFFGSLFGLGAYAVGKFTHHQKKPDPPPTPPPTPQPNNNVIYQ